MHHCKKQSDKHTKTNRSMKNHAPHAELQKKLNTDKTLAKPEHNAATRRNGRKPARHRDRNNTKTIWQTTDL
jgi:hypothetical protein